MSLFLNTDPPGPPSSWVRLLYPYPQISTPSSPSSLHHSASPCLAPPSLALLRYIFLTVLAGKTDRYASTHRVSRTDGHTFLSIKNKCVAALQVDGNRKFVFSLLSFPLPPLLSSNSSPHPIQSPFSFPFYLFSFFPYSSPHPSQGLRCLLETSTL
jgi:hypothetical protein